MNIKSLLLGSAAALAVVSGAQAADAIVAAEPEPVEYVRVCDAFGTGYFYIPGTETCLKVGGYVRAQLDWSESDDDDFDWDARTRGYLSIEAKNDSEIGTIGSYFAFKSWGNGDYSNSSFELDEAYITVGGFKVGYMYNYWDAGLSGETDDLGSNLINAIGYEYAADAFKVGVFVDELTDTYADWDPAFDYYGDNDNVGIEAMVSATFGPVTGTLLGGYDFAAENGAVRAIVEAEIGPGTLGLAAIYSSGVNAYYDLAEWTVAAEYAAKLTDKLTLTPGFQYWWNAGLADADGDFTGDVEAWKAGVTLDYAIAEGLKTKVSVQYADTDEAGVDGAWEGFVRLQRSF
ncbi:porin [Rhizobium sp. S95]|uniref:Porin n=1 Tax=Ciceribacter sichuanensis TaxID=2949647 RepID=A0AAJ1BSV8_9HYPH|nr:MULTISPECIES: porin [unclassified Ciceribacter]MCM2395330.1 porin [Ciceribacter sp. S95]MCO5955752.1 porin [Ciceribacter sp. S101]